MIQRVNAAAERHAQKLGLSNEVLSYCQIELNNKTNQFPRDGLHPFGVNYNNIKGTQELDGSSRPSVPSKSCIYL